MLPQQINDISHQLINACPACGAKHPVGQVTIIEEKKQSFLAHLVCQHCGAGLVARVTIMPQGLLGNAMVTDLTSIEVGVFKDGPPVTTDDVLSAHQLPDQQWQRFINQR